MLRVFYLVHNLKASSSIKKRRCLVNLVMMMSVGECVGFEKVENGGRVYMNKHFVHVCIQ